ncbi:MAG: glycosyltransferase family 2 protein, partial [Terriglobia bacterium]
MAGEMLFWREALQHGMNMFNTLTIAYFFVGNGVYTLLMGLSLFSAVAYNRRLAYRRPGDLRELGAMPPLTVIIPAYNEEHAILDAVHSALRADYPGLRVLVVDDGSSDATLSRLIKEFRLSRADFIYRPFLPTAPMLAFYANPDAPHLVVLSKRHAGKPDALNAGINFCRSPYFCTLDADCLIEPEALLRLMHPIVLSADNAVVSGGIIRILNGCRASGGQVQQVRLPKSWIENLQVVEYLRSFLFGRAGWNLMAGTVIVSGAMGVFQRQAVLEAGGFSAATVAEDME